MRPTVRRDADRLLGHAAAAKLSALKPAARFVTSRRFLRANPAMGFGAFSRACWMPFQRHACRCSPSSKGRPPIAAALPFVGCHPLVGFMATDTGRALAAHQV